MKIHLDPNVKPVIQSSRRLPFSLREKVEAKLDQLLEADIIEKVEGAIPWVSKVIVVPKANGDIRFCVDMCQANTAVMPEKHQIPTIEELPYDMNQSKVFTKLDIK